ncbi:MAG: YraN family protein [Alphaproteobacteria bacterium]|nr:YraN family protein [Alphaproteobacteria bacterium]
MDHPSQNSRIARGARSYKQGHRAEWLCTVLLRLKGYKIVATRYKTRQGEIDIVATRGSSLVFVEVKSRPTLLAAHEAISQQQQVRLSRAAALFHAHYRGYSFHTLRFDLMLVLPWHWPIHIQNAFACQASR